MTTAAPDAATADDALLVDRVGMPCELDGGIGWRARIGLVVLSSDYTIEHELGLMLRLPGVALHHSRIANDAEISPQSLARMESRIAQATALITPELPVDVVCYACTSGTLVIGEAAVHARIREARPGVACTTPMEAARAALAALGVSRVALIAPYADTINRRMRQHLLEHRIQVPVMGSWNLSNDNEVARLSPATLREAVLELGAHPSVQAVFVSCTSVRLVDQVEALEDALGKPVVSSNLATAWHCLRLAGVADAVPGYGRLMRLAGG